MQGPEWHTTIGLFVDDASFHEWFDNSRSDELVSKVDELEDGDTFEFSLLQKQKYYIMQCSPMMQQ
jgi:hypothetical protein